MTNPAIAPRKAGRPRNETLTPAILDAALETYVDLGWAGFNLDGVARRAGCGKAALYARWPDREALLYEVVARTYGEFVAAGEGLFDDLVALGHHLLEAHADHLRGAILWTRLRADQASHGGVFDRIDAELLQQRQRAYRQIVKRATARGEIAPGGAAMLLLDLFAGGLLHHLLYSPTLAERELREDKEALIRRFATGAIAAVRGI
jgi:AcrR family transcriptional regulator